MTVGLKTDDLSGQTQPSTASTYELMFRSSVEITAHNRVSYTVELAGSPFTGGVQASTTATRIVLPLALWEYRPKEGLELAVGRDEMPSGLGLPTRSRSFNRYRSRFRRISDASEAVLVEPAVPVDPLCVRRRAATRILETANGARACSGALTSGVNVRFWVSRFWTPGPPRSSTRSVGAYARLGFGRWGILAEHELAGRTMTDVPAAATTYIAGDTQVFVAPYEWLVASLAVDEVVTPAAANPASHVYRLAPGAQVRVSPNLTVVFTTLDAFADVGVRHSRTYSLQLAVKTVK